MSTQFVGPGKGVTRDRYGRPLIIPPHGGDPIGYTRATTYADALSDKEGLIRWKQRMTAKGLAQRDDLLLQVAATDLEDKQALSRLADEAAEHAGSMTAANVGTEIHGLTERMDRGEDVGTIPASYRGDLDAYRAATSHLEVVAIEDFGVNDDLMVAGTADRIYRIGDRNYIGDVKTGNIDYSASKIAMQLALYAHMASYDVETGTRTHRPLLDQKRAIVVHLPAGKGECTLHWIDIDAGWRGVQLAGHVREWRKRRDFMKPYLQATPAATDANTAQEASAALTNAIEAATTVTELEQLYLGHRQTWTDAHTERAAARKESLRKSA